MPADKRRIVFAFSLCVGGMDATTGILLVAAPAFTLGMFGASLPGGGAVLMRFIGTFVGGIGMSYLWGLAASTSPMRLRRLYGVWGTTAVARAAVAVFTIAAVAAGSLELQWLFVGMTDATVAIAQTALMRRGWLSDRTEQ